MTVVMEVAHFYSGRLEAHVPRTAVADAANDDEKVDDCISSSDDDLTLSISPALPIS